MKLAHLSSMLAAWLLTTGCTPTAQPPPHATVDQTPSPPATPAPVAQAPTPASIKGTPDGTTMPAEYAKALGRFLYIWGWPMANTHGRIAAMEKVPEPGLQGGILPVASMLTDYIDPAQRFVAAPNQDVVYGLSALRLDREPVVVQVPDFGDRFWVFQVADQRTDGFARLGKMYGTKPGFYLLVGPDWKGTPPAGITEVFRSPTKGAFVFPRVFADDTALDKDAIQPMINGIGVYPLSSYDGKVKTSDWRVLAEVPCRRRQCGRSALGGSGHVLRTPADAAG